MFEDLLSRWKIAADDRIIAFVRAPRFDPDSNKVRGTCDGDDDQDFG
jgi:hypothetical protein